MSICLGIYKKTVSKKALKSSPGPRWIPMFLRKPDGSIKPITKRAS